MTKSTPNEVEKFCSQTEHTSLKEKLANGQFQTIDLAPVQQSNVKNDSSLVGIYSNGNKDNAISNPSQESRCQSCMICSGFIMMIVLVVLMLMIAICLMI